MNAMSHHPDNRPPAERVSRRAPIVRCPVCDARSLCRTSDEISPETRRLYYACSNLACSMTWCSMLSVERVISPSGISQDFRPAHFKESKPPGRDFGQLALPDIMAPPPDRPG